MEKLNENKKLSDWIQQKENKKLLKKQELHNQRQDEAEKQQRKSERLERKSKKEKGESIK